jgi:hypothetical protein
MMIANIEKVGDKYGLSITVPRKTGEEFVVTDEYEGRGYMHPVYEGSHEWVLEPKYDMIEKCACSEDSALVVRVQKQGKYGVVGVFKKLQDTYIGSGAPYDRVVYRILLPNKTSIYVGLFLLELQSKTVEISPCRKNDYVLVKVGQAHGLIHPHKGWVLMPECSVIEQIGSNIFGVVQSGACKVFNINYHYVPELVGKTKDWKKIKDIVPKSMEIDDEALSKFQQHYASQSKHWW